MPVRDRLMNTPSPCNKARSAAADRTRKQRNPPAKDSQQAQRAHSEGAKATYASRRSARASASSVKASQPIADFATVRQLLAEGFQEEFEPLQQPIEPIWTAAQTAQGERKVALGGIPGELVRENLSQTKKPLSRSQIPECFKRRSGLGPVSDPVGLNNESGLLTKIAEGSDIDMESEVPSPVEGQHISTSPYAIEFYEWVMSTSRGWNWVRDLFAQEDRRGMSKDRWVELMTKKGNYDITCLMNVFREVKQEVPTDGGNDITLSDQEIDWTQVDKFQQRVAAVLANPYGIFHQSSRVPGFLKVLLKKYGSTFLVWRTILDSRGTGTITFKDFISNVRNLTGVNVQGKAIWDELRPDQAEQTSLGFQEFDPVEGPNVEQFAELIWLKIGCDLDKLWAMMDTQNKQYLTFNDFRCGAVKLGFQGDIPQLYRGLDGSGLGRVKREELEYIAKVTHLGQRRMKGIGDKAARGLLLELVIWAQQEIDGGPPMLLHTLGLEREQEVTIGHFAEKLVNAGFSGNAVAATRKVARLSDSGSVVPVPKLQELLSGTGGIKRISAQPRRHSAIQTRARSLHERGQRPFRPEEHGWCNSCPDFTSINQRRCKPCRQYFGNFGSLEQESACVSAPQNGRSDIILEPAPVLAMPLGQDNSENPLVEPIMRPEKNHKHFRERAPASKPSNSTGGCALKAESHREDTNIFFKMMLNRQAVDGVR